MIKFKSVISFDNETGKWSLMTTPEPGCTTCTDAQLAHLLRQVAASVTAPTLYPMISREVH